MQTRNLRAYGIVAAGLLTALTTSGISAQTPETPETPETPKGHPELSLLGIRLLGTFSDVLRKFGQPNEIQPGEPVVTGQGQGTAAPGMMGGGRPGGYPGMSGGPGMMGGGRPGMTGSPGSMGGRPGLPGMSGGPPGMSGYPGMMGGGGRPGMSGSPGSMGGYPGMGGGRPGMSGSPGSMGGYPGMGGANGANGANNNADSTDAGETTWWYHFPQKGLHYSFLFNKEGRVIQIQAYGSKPDPKLVVPRTAQGITLGSDLGQIIKRYGWSNDGEHDGDYVVLRYGVRNRVAFQTRRNKVLGIVLGRVNPPEPAPVSSE
jgi:hypothetical protein